MAKYIIEIPDEVEVKDTSLVPFDMMRPKWYQEIYDEAYQKGLGDAWNAAKKIACNTTMSFTDLVYAFDTDDIDDIFQENTASEAMERLRRWEQEKDDFHIGDVVFVPKIDKYAIVTKNHTPDMVCAVTDDGDTFTPPKDQIQKTGRNFPMMKELLNQIRKEKR